MLFGPGQMGGVIAVRPHDSQSLTRPVRCRLLPEAAEHGKLLRGPFAIREEKRLADSQCGIQLLGHPHE